jgi:prepilin signal peptidase PulO-like enzyme (type II secretory pathway)
MLVELVFIFLFGLFIGSFLGVVIDRLPGNKSIIRGRSYCDFCKTTLKWYDMFPVLSFILLRGKCRNCKHELSLFYPAIELITAVLFASTFLSVTSPLTVLNFKFLIYLSYLFAIVSSFIAIFFIDLGEGVIPNKILVLDTALTLVWLIINPLSLITNHLLSGIGSFVFFVAIAYVFYMITKKEGMGGGDIKLVFVLGLFLGFPAILMSLYLAFVIGALVALTLIIFKKNKLKGSLPFGPFLIFAGLLTLFFQNQLYTFFIKILGI